MNPSRIVPLLLDWFARNARELPWRRTRDPYAIWVSEVMLQQTLVKTVLPYWERWMRTLPTIQALARAKPGRLHKLWEGLGYYARVRNMQKAAKMILGKHGGRFPSRFEDVLELPGIGRYTAGAICSIAFGQPKPVLDGNVIRVLTRVFGIDGDPREKEVNATLWQLAEELVKKAVAPFGASSFNQALMELGALVCTPRQPRCENCPVMALCTAFQEQRIEDLPALKPRVAASFRRFVAFVVAKRGRVLVRQRPAGVVNAHLWEFPNTEIDRNSDEIGKSARKVLGTRPQTLKRLCSIKHTITRYRITLDAYYATGIKQVEARGETRWLTRAELKRLAFTSAHGKVLRRWSERRGAGNWMGMMD